MKIKILFLSIILLGCNGVDKNNYPPIAEAEIIGKNRVKLFFELFNPEIKSELVTTKYVILVYKLSNYNSKNNFELKRELLKNGWRIKQNKNNYFFCNRQGEIIETLEPYNLANRNIDSIIAEQSKNEWRVGYSYRKGGNWECTEN